MKSFIAQVQLLERYISDGSDGHFLTHLQCPKCQHFCENEEMCDRVQEDMQLELINMELDGTFQVFQYYQDISISR